MGVPHEVCVVSRTDANRVFGIGDVHSTPRRSYRFDEIDLRAAVCAGYIPEELGALTKLEGLWLHDNRLTGTGRIPWMLGLECDILDAR